MDSASLHKISRLLVLLVAGLTLLLCACGGGDTEAPEATSPGGNTSAAQDESLETVEVPTRWASANAGDLPSLIGSSEEVFTGLVQRQTGEREEKFGGGGQGAFPVSIYELKITRSFVGERAIGSFATFEQAGGVAEQGGTRVRLMLEGDPAVEVGKEYLFFASLKENGTLSAPPYARLEVTASGTLMPLAVWEDLGALQQLSRVPAEAVDGEIDAASQ